QGDNQHVTGYVVYGSAGIGSGGQLNLDLLDGKNGFVLQQSNNFNLMHRTITAAGDVNGDGYEDFIVAPDRGPDSSSQKTQVGFGGINLGMSGALDLSALAAGAGFSLVSSASSLGYSVSAAGDVNGDGYADLLIGAPKAGSNNVGQSYILY